MQRLKFSSSSLLKRFLYSRSFNSLTTNDSLADKFQELVLVEGIAGSGTAILNRPTALNALNTPMIARLHKLYKNWEDDPNIGVVLLKGRGKAFSAGGDIVSIYNAINKGNLEECKEFFWTLCRFIYLLGTYLKPHVALLDGITFGGGAGISIPGTFRLATDQTIFATPETLIGYHPDAAASFYLPRLPGHLGEYLALTGDKINGAEMMFCGLATHYSQSAKLPLIEEAIGKLMTDDPSVVETSLQSYGELVQPDHSSFIQRIEMLDKCFSHETMEEIINALESEASKTQDPWCISTLKKLQYASPLSLKISLKAIREGRFQTFDQCLVREYRTSLQAWSRQISNDFCEGVRARVVDKDFKPKWDPPSLELVTKDMVDQYFTRLTPLEPDLELPTEKREAI
ncbi:hydrolase [Lithospermum erythrorhizon]|uniref:3-hydroxyisobutyryl-CoA hydrolase n=1 Tax=Lithospermum erythrorhizon TaxID=34254 RepID=A0AAV3P0Q5_LITER